MSRRQSEAVSVGNGDQSFKMIAEEKGTGEVLRGSAPHIAAGSGVMDGGHFGEPAREDRAHEADGVIR